MTDQPLAGAGVADPQSVNWTAAKLGTFTHRFAETLLAERERWPLWIPVGLGAGIACYFALPVEPALWLGLVCAGLALAAVLLARGRPGARIAALVAMVVAGGFAVAQLRSTWVAAPVLGEPLRAALVTGRIVEASIHDRGLRLVLDRAAIRGLAREATPVHLRVKLRNADPTLVPGVWVRLRAGLSPPPGPSAPGAFDFARRAYFDRLGAVGFAMGPVQRIAVPGDPAPWNGWVTAIGRLRQTVTLRLLSGLDGQPGAVAAALLTGERGAIDDDVLVAMRNAGLAHLLAISGLHLGLVAAILFFMVRALLALCEPVALRYPIKKWAAVAALAGTLFYLALAGATIPTQRAFLMSGLVIVAILLDRTGVSMRSVAWAATAVLLIEPESLPSASFQMSFAAVTALVAVYERVRDRRIRRERQGRVERMVVYLAGVALATLIASLATAPFAVYHFNRLAAYGLAANLIAVPLTALWIMPWGIIALALMPLGLEGLALTPMGWGIEVVIAVARTVAAWPGAVWLLPAMPLAGLVLAASGGLWLCLWRRRWRWLGTVVLAAAVATFAFLPAPDVLIDGSGRLFAVRTGDDELALSTRARARFAGDIWLRRNGQAESAPWPGNAPRLRCDLLGCIYRAKGHVVALVRDPRAFAEDCRVADTVVAAFPLRRPCLSATTVIDRTDLRCAGAHAVFLENDGVRLDTVAAHRGMRPWTGRPVACRVSP